MRLADLMPGAPGRRLDAEQKKWLSVRGRGVRIGVYGATGAVGLELLALLAEAGVPAEYVTAYASARSAGERLAYGDGSLPVFDADADDGRRQDVAVLATPAAVSRRLAGRLVDQGVRVSDNSSAFRGEAPLVVPEINGDAITRNVGLVASPNCTTTIALTAAEGLRRAVGVRSIGVTSAQAVSGAGRGAMRALLDETREAVDDKRDVVARWLDEPAAFNVFPHESAVDEGSGLCGEEAKIIAETRRLWGAGVDTDTACLRAPVLRTHTVVVRCRVKRPCDAERARAAIGLAPGVEWVTRGPSALAASCRCAVLAGRLAVRGDSVRFVVAGDQLLKGAAWNALQNAMLMAPERGA